MFDRLNDFDLARWRAVRAFAQTRAEFFADAALVLGQVKLPQIFALRISSNEGTPLGDAYQDISSEYRAGKKLSEAFGPYLLDGERLAMSGWDSADSDEVLAEGFKRIAQISKATKQIKTALKGALIGAGGSVAMLMVMLWMMKAQVFPSLDKTYPVHNWIFPARLTYYLITAVFGNLVIFAGTTVGSVALYVWALPNWTSPVRRRLDHSMLFSWYRSYRSLQVLLGLALHLESGRGVSRSLRLIMEYANPWEQWYLEQMWERNERGVKGGAVFDVGFFDPAIMDRILLLSAAGSAEEALENIAFTSQKELLEQYRDRIVLAGEVVKKASLVIGAIPMMLFFTTLGNFIVDAVSSGFKIH